MATEAIPPVPAPVPQLPESPCRPAPPVQDVDWFRRMPTGGGTVYQRHTD